MGETVKKEVSGAQTPLTPKDADRYDGTGPVTIRDDHNRPNTPAIATTADA